jgi:hypothetical protein
MRRNDPHGCRVNERGAVHTIATLSGGEHGTAPSSSD